MPSSIMRCTRVVLDTNVLVSAVWKPGGLEAQVVRLAIDGSIILCASREIHDEYRDVLFRTKFAHMREQAEALFMCLAKSWALVETCERISVASDEDDNRFLECAAAAAADYLVTGNLKHYPAEWQATKVVNARQFLSLLP